MPINLIRWLLAALAFWPALAAAQVEVIPTQGRNIWRLAIVRLGAGQPTYDIVGSTYDNRICAFDSHGKHLWDAPVGAFVFDLAAGDLNGDGRDEILAASADNLVYAFDANGNKLWTHDLGAPVWQVAVARLDGKTPSVVAAGISREVVALNAEGKQTAAARMTGAIRALRAGDFDGDGNDEVALIAMRTAPSEIQFLRGPKLEPLAVKPLIDVVDSALQAKAPAGSKPRSGKATTGRKFSAINAVAADIDGDHAAEFLFPSGAIGLASAARGASSKEQVRYVAPFPDAMPPSSYAYHYRMRMVAAGDLTGEPGVEVALLDGPDIELCDASGRLLGRATAPCGFTDLVYLPGTPHGSVLLGSSPNGDDNLYRLSFTRGWQDALANIHQPGRMAQMTANLAQLSSNLSAWKGRPLDGAQGPYDIVVGDFWVSKYSPRLYERWTAEVRAYEKEFPYPNLRFSTVFWPSEAAPLLRPDGKPWAREARLPFNQSARQIADIAAQLERAKCHFIVQVGHGCNPYIELSTVAAILDAAPEMCLGFLCGEDEQVSAAPYYYENWVKPVLELCLKHHKQFFPINKGAWWAYWPSEPRMRASIFNGRYRSVIVPCVEDSNSRSPDINLAARVGLWLNGEVDNWASRICADWFCSGRAWEWEYVLTGSPHLRYQVAQALLGARVFMPKSGERDHAGNWTRIATEGTGPFLHMLGKGVIAPPGKQQMQSISSVALAVEKPSERFAVHGFNYHNLALWDTDGTDRQPWPFDRLDCYWNMTPTPAINVAAYLWGRTCQSPNHVPTTTPQGFVCLLPGGQPQSAGPWETIWSTDGDTLTKGGRSYSLEDARQAMLADLAEAQRKQPFAVEGRVFHQIVATAKDHYVLALIDPGWFDPAQRQVVLKSQLPGKWTVTDRLTGADLGNLGRPLEIVVPAGTLRILECRR